MRAREGCAAQQLELALHGDAGTEELQQRQQQQRKRRHALPAVAQSRPQAGRENERRSDGAGDGRAGIWVDKEQQPGHGCAAEGRRHERHADPV